MQTIAPTFVRGTTPYWEAACGCKTSALAFTPCALHAAAPELLAALEEIDRLMTAWRDRMSPLDKFGGKGTIATTVSDIARAAIRKAKGE